MAKTLRVTGKLSVVDGADDNTSYGQGTPRVMSIAEITFDPQVQTTQTQVEDAEGTLTAGDTFVQFSALRIMFKSKRMTREHFAAMLFGSVGAESSDYYPLTMMQAANKHRHGAAKLELYHPSLGSSVPIIKTDTPDVLLYKALRPDGQISGGVETDAEFGFAMDIDDGQKLMLHKIIAEVFPAAS